MLPRLLMALSRARRWVDATIATHWDGAATVASLNMRGVERIFRGDVVSGARVAVVDRPPRPPLERWGLRGDAGLAAIDPRGISLRDLIFIRRGCEDDESLIVHELIHVLQWRRLGPRRFLAAYGLMLLEHGYDGSPLETMAYDLQRRFDRGELTGDIEPIVQRRTDEAIAELGHRSWRHRMLLAGARFVP
jgi:hypothetical protein